MVILPCDVKQKTFENSIPFGLEKPFPSCLFTLRDKSQELSTQCNYLHAVVQMKCVYKFSILMYQVNLIIFFFSALTSHLIN